MQGLVIKRISPREDSYGKAPFLFSLFQSFLFVLISFGVFFEVTLACWMSIFQGVSCQLDLFLIIHERWDGVLG